MFTPREKKQSIHYVRIFYVVSMLCRESCLKRKKKKRAFYAELCPCPFRWAEKETLISKLPPSTKTAANMSHID